MRDSEISVGLTDAVDGARVVLRCGGEVREMKAESARWVAQALSRAADHIGATVVIRTGEGWHEAWDEYGKRKGWR